MDRLRDSRDMTGGSLHTTPSEVRASWRVYVDELRLRGRGFPNRPDGELELLELDDELVAYVNAGRWVADCPCGAGVACWPAMREACCYDCGTIRPVAFPPARERAKGEAVLLLRENPDAMHWKPQTETVDDLKLENLERGVRFA